MSQSTIIISYSELLEELEARKQECHLLLGNGFNNSLGISTDYKSIFTRMQDEEPVYKKIAAEIEQDSYDIEKLIGKMKQSLLGEGSEIKKFLESYIENKVKFDFMKSASSIVKENVKEIYQENNKNIYLLFKNFSNYFTLNYDNFLYLLLMKFKKTADEKQPTVAFQNTELFQREDLDQNQNNIYKEIQNIRKNGRSFIGTNDNTVKIDLNKITKSYFQSQIKLWAKRSNKGWSAGDIEKASDLILEEEKENSKLTNLNDGFSKELFDINPDQNIFFLHGSFHIYKDRGTIKKITQKQDKALYERFGNIINAEEKDIVCILTNGQEEKEKQIADNTYLKKCSEVLASLSGSIVIFGSSLAENDGHIFNAINHSQIDKVYISSTIEQKEQDLQKATDLFPLKEITLFDYQTVSYDMENKGQRHNQ
ncbi:DUF4917 family protein [Candidatus Haliotispira prima]|uniref:DUF4917 family protein n=1 Tax=Candidatus Haliotispira prima TaxID=3034016 RepID=A0ABY8MK30_9SPIO|nr:DUF4917 family protein [Candidatus Haliotispira prima]